MELPHAALTFDDATLVARTLEGDLSAFDYLVDRHQVAVKSFLACRLRDRSAVDDLAQETFILAFKRLADFERDRPFLPWLRGIAFNLLRNHRRSQARATTTDDIESFFVAAVEQSARHEDEALDAMKDCLAALGAEARELVHRRYTLDMPVAEICALTGAKHSAVTMALHRARARLEECIAKKLPAWRREEAS
jgi:RNA polymerase sigma-70 factor (ECF subfamily)